MVYLLEMTEQLWDRVPYVSRELVDKRIRGIPLQQSDMPAEPKLEGQLELPEIAYPTSGFLFVSDRGRAALEELAPGCIAFFPLNLKVPEHMRPAKAYFLIDVLPRAQCIDWDRTPTVPRVVRAPDGRESRSVKGGITNPLIKFKAVTPETPKIWREADLDRPTVQFFFNKEHILMRDELWGALNAKLPGQLVARKLA